MKKQLVAIATAIVLSSCSTLIHRKTTNIHVYSDIDSVRICNLKDTTLWFNTPATIYVERSENNLVLLAKKDTVEKVFHINSKLSASFWLGNMFSGLGILGYAIDLTNPKRFTYPHYVTLNLKSTDKSIHSYHPWAAPEKGLLTFKLSIPEANHFYLNKGHGYGSEFGFLGISGGIDYYFTDKYCLNMDVGALTDFIVPVPAAVDYEGSYDQSFATYADIQLGRDFKRFHLDAGFQFNRTSYYERETIEVFPEYIDVLRYSQTQNNFGLALSSYYKISNSFHLGLNYYPSFIGWNNNKIQTHYSHILFLELNFRLEAYRPTKR